MSDQREPAPLRIGRAHTEQDWQDATALVRDHVAWMREWTGFDPVAVQPVLAAELDGLRPVYDRDDVAVFVGRRGDTAVGLVTVCRHPDDCAEVKRMFVRPAARGAGVGDGLVAAALDAASGWGCHTVWLETVHPAMQAAIALYGRHGFVATTTRPPTIDVIGTIVMERLIDVASRCP